MDNEKIAIVPSCLISSDDRALVIVSIEQKIAIHAQNLLWSQRPPMVIINPKTLINSMYESGITSDGLYRTILPGRRGSSLDGAISLNDR